MHMNENNGNKTPLTDVARYTIAGPCGIPEDVVAASVAEQLERRCAELEEENARLDHCYKLSLDSMQLHKDKADELRRDRERLDWLLEHCLCEQELPTGPYERGDSRVFENRQQIDAAIRDSQTGDEEGEQS